MEYNECPVLASDSINREHDALVDLINQAELEVMMGRPAMTELSQLQRFMLQHFSDEQTLMQRYAMPQLHAHQQDHEDLLALIQQACRSTDLAQMLDILSDQLPNAIVQHIDQFDRHAVNWLKRHRRSAA